MLIVDRLHVLINIGIVLFSLFVAMFVSGWLIAWLINRLLSHEKDASIVNTIQESTEGVGKYIGWIERFLILCFIFIGYFQGIGFILAAKSILRFGEVKNDADRRFSEYVIVGTLLSFAFAIVIGLAMRFMLGMSITI